MAIFKTERSLMFAYVRLKSPMFAYFEKKYFFPALWTSAEGTQWVGWVKMVEGSWLRVEGLPAPEESSAVCGGKAELGIKVETAARANLCVTKFGLLRGVTRMSTKVRTDQARKSAMLRIVTGGANFLGVWRLLTRYGDESGGGFQH
jgi:hypothetical protein